jgi:glucokinase
VTPVPALVTRRSPSSGWIPAIRPDPRTDRRTGTDLLTIGVDIGGTKILAGVVDEKGTILDSVKVPTPEDSDKTADAIAEAVRKVRGDHEVGAVGLGAAGFIDADRATVLFAPNVSWVNEPLKARIEQRVGLPVVVENDANAAAWGEARFGAAAGHDDVVVITVGTGIGGGLILNGQLYRGRFGIGGEPGHYRVVPDGRPCGCGNKGCFEQYASGNALVRAAKERAAVAPGKARDLLALGDGTVEGIQGAHITEAARVGDTIALAAFEEVADWLGQGMSDMSAFLDPSAFVLAGGVSEAGDLLRAPAAEAYRKKLAGRGHRPYAQVLTATLGPDAGLIGAADLARR